ncbi:zinc finger protein 830 [Toxorhynchites rutilus septentrionalis]|uniref:zinc finger protein 830 n=1 Tax=Toxorhynchites rutilus septentrionalis TaxID=329112 RepID=UPI0024794357|nr:zinc finger protein 830 [Toxorhynchites rutilus septentrionalis]
MSAAFKLAKKKYTQQDLRRIMSETKANAAKQQTEANVKRIESPLAKYNEAGQLTCALCCSVVRSEAVWKVHINSKQHKENIEQAKRLKQKVAAQTPAVSQNAPTETTHGLKRSNSSNQSDTNSNKKVRGILKNNETEQSSLPTDFFDSDVKIKTDLVNIRLPSGSRAGTGKIDKESEDSAKEPQPPPEEEKIPEGFFDDPKADAKARNIEYKDPNDEEWERFQKEIKEATTESMAIISEEQEESTAERQISEIDEQIRNWSRVLSLERKKEEVRQKTSKKSALTLGAIESTAQIKMEVQQNSDDDADDGEFDEFPDWRAKKSFH